ncbi:MAG: hypothetical protein DRO14_05245, partial [Thermoprotei archaeon]
LGIPYSRAWETIAKIERILGVRIIEAKRGGKRGGGTRLTDNGRNLLQKYVEFFEKLTRARFDVKEVDFSIRLPDLVYMGSHDPAVEYLMGLLRDVGISEIEVLWVGSGCGLAALTLGEADIAGVHLYDPGTNEYNIPYLGRYWLVDYAVVIRGYMRELGIVHRLGEGITLNDILEGLLKGRLRYVNRNRGSGTRIFADHFIVEQAAKLGLSIRLGDLKSKIKGYDVEVATHRDVASAIARGDADVGFTIRLVAEGYGLNFIPIMWEYFDFIVPRNRLDKSSVRAFIEMLRSSKFRSYIEKLPGYKPHPELGSIVSVTK